MFVNTSGIAAGSTGRVATVAPAEVDEPAEALRAPALFARMRRAFGRVKVGNAGQPMQWRPARSVRDGSLRMQIAEGGGGEIYRFNCPHCGDTRFRGWVSHYFGQPDPITGNPMTHLVGCFNEDCYKKEPGRRDEFILQVLGVMSAGYTLPPCEPGEVAKPRGPVSLPGTTVSLLELAPNHAAREYVRGRGFDPDELGHVWGVGYCLDAPDEHESYAIGRLIIPLRRGGQLIGWQARKIREGGAGKKYFNCTGFSKGNYLFGMDEGAGGRLAVLVEGVPSVWAMGPPTMAVLGSKLGSSQCDVLRPIASRDGLVVVMFDPGAEEKAAAAFDTLQPLFPGRVVVANLPTSVVPADCRRWPIEKIDPGELRREKAWSLVGDAVAAAGFRLADFL